MSHVKIVKILSLLLSLYVPAAFAEVSPNAWMPVKLAPLNSFIKVTGRVIPQDGALYLESARIQGSVVNVLAREGDHIKAGAPLFEINSAECTNLTEERRVAEKNKATELLKGVERRQSQLHLRATEKSCLVVATGGGTITKRNLESGAAFNIGDALVTVLDTKRLSVELDLPERDVSAVIPGQKVVYRLAADTDKPYNSTVRSVVPAIDSASRTARVRLTTASLPANASLDGLVFGEIENRSKEPVYVIPARAIVFSKNARYVVRGPDAPAAVEIEVLGEANDNASIRPRRGSELKENDSIATDRVIFLYRKLSEGPGQP